MQPLTLHITGMSCSHCLNAVNKALGQLEGVAIREVRIGRADLDFDPGRIERAAIVAAVTEAGFGAVAG